MNELNEFFKLVAEEKRKKKEHQEIIESKQIRSDLDEIVSSLGNPFSSVKPKKKKKKVVVEEVKEEIKEEVSLVEKSLGLLAEPSNTKQQKDPLTPLDQKFATIDDLQKHYKLFLERIQQQLSTLGGGGEVNLAYMEVPITTVTSSSYSIKYDDYYIGVNYAGAVTLTLPKSDREGKKFVVKDELGEASKGTNRYITILPAGSDLIDGRNKAILAFDYGSLTFIWKNNSWRVV
jgi:hypothetical protein